MEQLKLSQGKGDTLSINVMTERIAFCDTKWALVEIDDNSMCGETIKNDLQIMEVLLWVGTSNEDIINVSVG